MLAYLCANKANSPCAIRFSDSSEIVAQSVRVFQLTDRFGVVSEGGTGVGRSAGRSERRRNIVIVGAGLSGTMVAANLLRRSPPGTRITLIERKPPFARGVAYGTLSPVHRLNVMAGKL